MEASTRALLVHDGQTYFRALKATVERQEISTRQARDCRETSLLLSGRNASQIVFTDTQLLDGTWKDVVNMAAQAPNAPKVIVVSRLVDIKLYLDALEEGAFDFIVPPFVDVDLAYIMRSALLSARPRLRQHERRGARPSLRYLQAGAGNRSLPRYL
jgi:DNA-binding NtrC family response regulator